MANVDQTRIIILESYYKHGECNMRMFTSEDAFKTYVHNVYVNDALDALEEYGEQNEENTITKDPENFDWHNTDSLLKWLPTESDPLICWMYWAYVYGNYTVADEGGWGIRQIIHIDKNGVCNEYK